MNKPSCKQVNQPAGEWKALPISQGSRWGFLSGSGGLPVYRTHSLPAKIMTGSIAELLLVKEPADPV
jgi:hypothetical protein